MIQRIVIIFFQTHFSVCLGSDFFQKKPHLIDKLLEFPLNDYDLGNLFDAIKYADLTENYLELLFEYIDYEKFINDLEYSCTSALNTVSYYIFHFDKEDIYFRLHKEFLEFIKPLDRKNLSENQKTFFEFFYKALLYSRYGKESHRMPFEVEAILNSDLVFNI